MFSMRSSPALSRAAKSAWIAAAVAITSWQGDVLAGEERRVTTRSTRNSHLQGGIGRDPVRTEMERLSEQEIKAFYVRCSQEVSNRRLDGGEAMVCSVGYDVLLKKHFSNNFDLLLAWSRAQERRVQRK